MPKTYTPEQRAKAIEAVIEGLSKGTPLTVICCGEGMPCDDTIRDWAEADLELGRDIARAREAGFDQIALDALAIADETSNDTKRTEHGEQANSEWISRSKLRVETRLKLLAKWDPKRYGELVKLGNADGSNIDLSDRLNAARERVARGD
jgi:hypothetical protein